MKNWQRSTNLSQATHFRWVVIGLLFAITVTNYIDRSSISFAITLMSKDLHLNPSEAGLILGAFGIGYVATTFLGGIAVDHMGARRILSIAVICWSAAIFLTGLATGFLFVFLCRILLGVAEGPNFPVVARCGSDWLSPHERVVALSASLVAVPIALAIGGPIASQLILHISWRWMFIILGILALAWAPLWWWLFRDNPRDSSHVNAAELNIITAADEQAPQQNQTHTSAQQWRCLLTNPTLLANYWAFFVFGYYVFFFMTWLPNYLETTYHLHLANVGWLTVIPWLLSAIFMWSTGHLCDWIFRRTGNLRWSRSYLIALSQLLAAVCTLPIILSHDLVLSIIFISLAIAFSMSTNAAFYAVNIDVIKSRAGTALGIMDCAFAIAGFLAPALTGWIIHKTGHFSAAFLLLAALAFSSVILVICFHHPKEYQDLPPNT